MSFSHKTSIAALAMVAAMGGSAAFGQVASGRPPAAINGDLNPREISGVPSPTPPGTPGRQPLSSAGATLQDQGITVNALAFEQFIANPDMGAKPGHASNTMLFVVGADFNMNKIANIEGGTFHFLTAIYPFGERNTSMAPQIGDGLAGFQYVNGSQQERLKALSYEQHFGTRLVLEAGRMNPSASFGLANCENINTCYLISYQLNADILAPANSVLGGRASFAIDKHWFAQVGVFEDNPTRIRTNGYRFDLHGDIGTLSMAEVGYKSDFRDTRYPGRYEFINYYRPYMLDRKVPTKIDTGGAGLFALGQQVVWRRDGGEVFDLTPERLTVYGAAAAAYDDRQPYKGEAYLGLNWTGFLNNRPIDRVGVKVQYVKLGSNEAAFETAARAAAGGGLVAARTNEYAFEVNGHFQLAKYVAFEPSVQYFVNPNSYYSPTSKTLSREGFLFAGAFIIPIDLALGLK